MRHKSASRLVDPQVACAVHLCEPAQLPHRVLVFLQPLGSVQNRSLMYLSPPSQRIETTTESRESFCASVKAARTLAPALTPTNKPSSRARRRVIACASSVAISTVSSA